MHKVFAIADIFPIIEEKLQSGGSVVLMASGTSMSPLLCNQRDSVVLEPVKGPLQKNALPLYRRQNGQFVLHRIVGFEKNGDYILCGDNQLVKEHNVQPEQIIGVVKGFTRKGKSYLCTSAAYKIYCKVLPLYKFLRHSYYLIRKSLRSCKRRLYKLAIRKV